MRPALLTALSVALVLGFASVARACPSCQAAVGHEGDLARGLYYSILFMMSMPFAIIGGFAGLAYRAVQRERRRVEAEQATAQELDA